MRSSFPQTRWSLVLSAGAGDSEQAAEALAELCQTYRQPLYAHLRRDGHSHEDAEDLTQDFIAHVIGTRAFEKMQGPERGKLRSFLLRGLQNWAINARRSASAQKRGGGAVPVSIEAMAEDERRSGEPSTRESPEVLFDRHWVQSLIDAAHARLGADCERAGKALVFEVLSPMLDRTDRSVPMREAAEQLGVTEGNARVLLYRLRAQFRKAIEAEVARTVGSDGEVAEELAYLRAILADGL
ncbi:MAG: sigma-70 family RNA polymerase sigma factor [Verrucomicrobiales bacterium]